VFAAVYNAPAPSKDAVRAAIRSLRGSIEIRIDSGSRAGE
jgi:hypothetical protein